LGFHSSSRLPTWTIDQTRKVREGEEDRITWSEVSKASVGAIIHEIMDRIVTRLVRASIGRLNFLWYFLVGVHKSHKIIYITLSPKSLPLIVGLNIN
jgi:hypothetical protein